MAQAYTPGLKVTNRTPHRCRRLLPIKGEVVVSAGEVVEAEQVVARTFMPGDITPLNMANLLAMPPADVADCMLRKEGDTVKVGDELAQSKGIFGLFKNTVKSKHEGTIETISHVTGQVILRGEPIPIEVKAYLAGRVVEVIPEEGCVIENEITFIQGIFGVGGESYGTIKMAAAAHDQPLTHDLITPDMKGCVIVGGARVTNEAIKHAIEVGAAGVVSGGIDDQDLKEILGYDLGVAITGTERIGLSVLVTEGFGDIAMAERTFSLLRQREGDAASINGATQIRAGVMRPEIVIPLTAEEKEREQEPDHTAGQLEIGRPVRIIRDPYFGLIGEVAGLPPEPQALGSGSKARVLEVRIDSGESVVIPRANVELIEA
jgi:transcription antitermination factor NusG